MNETGTFILGSVLLYLSCTIASAGGIGGGGLNVPILLVAFGFSYKKAVVLSLCTVLGNYISQSVINWSKTHPAVPTRPLIYWDAVLVLLPAQLGGSNVGVIIAAVFPETVLLILAMLVIVYAIAKTGNKGIILWQKESEANTENVYHNLVHSQYSIDEISEDSVSSHSRHNSQRDLMLESTDHGTSVMLNRSQKNEINFVDGENPKVSYPYRIFQVLGAVWVVYAAIFVTTQTAVDYCSTPYFILLFCTYPPLVVTIYWGINYIASRQRLDYGSVVEGDINFNLLTFIPPFSAFVIGILCSLLGIGGGELMGPLLLHYQVLPIVSTATTSMMSLLNTASNILHYAILGEIEYETAVITFAIGIFGGITGRLTALYISKKYGRYSILVFMLVTVLITSLALLIYHVTADDTDFSFHALC